MAKVACPKCGGEIIVARANYYCKNFRPTGDPEDCNFVVWRNDLDKFGKADLSEKEMLALLRGTSIPLSLKSQRTGNKFECEGKLAEQDSNDGKRRWKVQFVFPEKVLGDD